MGTPGSVDELIVQEALEGAVLGLRVRRLALCAFVPLLLYLAPFPDVLYYHGLILGFVVTGEIMLRRVRRGRLGSWEPYGFVAADMLLLVFTLLAPNPFAQAPYPPPLTYYFNNFVYLFTLLAQLAFAYRPRLVLWGGLVGAGGWIAGTAWMLALPEVRVRDTFDQFDPEALRAALGDANTIDVGTRVQEVAVFLIVAAMLAVAVGRSRRLVRRQAEVARERANLARYFAPAMVESLARRDTPLSAPREADVAVLFVDIVGFTRWAEPQSASAVIAAMRDVNEVLEAQVFEHGGTLEKFTGDGIMATFGTPDPRPDDAARAVACVRSIVAAFADDQPFRLALGLHFGPVVLGDVGSERRMEFAVLGDSVNVASRLERLARDFDARAVLSDAVVVAAGADTAGLQYHPAVPVRGRDAVLALWTI